MRTRKSTSSLLGLDDAASSLSRNTNASTHASHGPGGTIDPLRYPPTKRRKVVGLNARFDRMIKSVNSMLSYKTSSPASSRKRMQSSGTSSVSSHDIPKTPVDPYRSLYPGNLGSDFSVLKMKKSLPLARNSAKEFPKPVAPPKEPKSPLPGWLANTFCSLEVGHPLRGLLSPSCVNTELKSNSPSVELPGTPQEEKVFAFSPFDKPEEASDAAYLAENALTVPQHSSADMVTGPTPLHVQFSAPTEPLPFSTPGCFAPIRRSAGDSIVNSMFQKPETPVAQQVTPHITNMMCPPASPASQLRSGDVNGRPQLTEGFSNLIPDVRPSSDFNTRRHYQVSRGGRDNLNVYATPGPTFACSRPVYFDSPTEDPSLSDPLQPKSYELDLNAIDFRWHPFLRSNASEGDRNGRPVSPSSVLGYAVPNQDEFGDQSGWDARFVVDKRGVYGASNEDLPSLTEDVDIAYLDDVGAIGHSNVDAAHTKLSTISNTIRPWPSPIDDVQNVGPTFASPGMFLSPLRDQPRLASKAAASVLPRGDGENIRLSEELALPHGKEMRAVGSEAHRIRPSTPIRQVHVSPPSTPRKFRSSQLCEKPRAPVHKTSSALSWMIPLKPSRKRAVAIRDDGDRRFSHVPVNDHDSIESWGE